MPMIAAAAASAFAAVSSVAATVASAAGLTFTGLNVATAVSALKVLSVASSIYSLTKKPKASMGTPSAIAFKADPNAPIGFVAGTAMVGGHIAFAQTHGPKNRYLSYVTLLAAGGPVKAIQPFRANDEVVNFTTPGRNGEEAAGRYLNRMWQKFSLGAVGAAALIMTATGSKDTPADHPPGLYEWTAAHKISGTAHSLWTLSHDPDKYPNGTPKPSWEVSGNAVYDPRKDSTYPGGDGPQRLNDQSTWSFDGQDNPYLQAITFLRGFFYNGVRVGGAGLPVVEVAPGVFRLAGVDMDAFVQGANVADANGWKVSFPWTTIMRKWDVLSAFLAAGSGRPVARGAQISCVVNMPRVSIGTITEGMVTGDVSVTGSQTLRDRVNTIIPKCRMPSQKWTVQPFGKVTGAAYVAEDGGEERPREMEFESVASDGGEQVRQLAAYELTGLREGLVAMIPCAPAALKYKAGDCLTVSVPESLLNGQKMVVIKRDFDPASLSVTLTVQSETDGKHAFALGQTDEPPATPVLTGIDPTVVQPPAPTTWTVTPTPTPGGPGTGPGVVPTVVITTGGDDPRYDDAGIEAIVVRYRRPGVDPGTGLARPWSSQTFPHGSTRLELVGLAPGTTYEVEVAYVVRGVLGDFASVGTITTGALEATVAAALTDVGGSYRPASEILEALDAVPGLIGEAVTELDEAIGLLDDALDDLAVVVTDPTTGLVKKVADQQVAIDGGLGRIGALEVTVNTPATGLSARVGALETVTTNGTFATATRVAVLEARATGVPNLLVNGDFADGAAEWDLVAGGGPTVGYDAQVGAYAYSTNYFCSVVYPASPGQSRSVSADMDGSQAGSHVYVQWLPSNVVAAVAYAGPSWANRARSDGTSVVAPAGTTGWRVVVSKGPAAYVAASRIKVNTGVSAADWTDEATSRESAARIGVLETVTTNGTFAEATRVTALEVRVNVKPNLVKNPSAQDGVANWANGFAGPDGVGMQKRTDLTEYGPTVWSLNKPLAYDTGGWRHFYQDIPARPGEYTLSWDLDIFGFAGSVNAYLESWSAGFAGYTASAIPGRPSIDTSPDTSFGERRSVSISAGAGTAVVRAVFGINFAGQPAGYKEYILARVKVETGRVATPYNEQAHEANLNARLVTVETVTTDGTFASATRVTALEARSGGANLLRRSLYTNAHGQLDFAPWTWSKTFAGAGDRGVWGYNDSWAPLGERSMFGYADAGSAIGTYDEYMSETIPVELGKRYCASVFSGILGPSSGAVFMYLCNSAGTPVANSFTGAAAEVNTTASGGQNLASFKRLKNFFTVTDPAHRYVRVVMRHTVTAVPSGECHAFWNRPMLSEATATQTDAPPYSGASLEARTATTEATVATLDGYLNARWAVGTAVPGAAAFIEARAVLTPGGVPTSDVAIGARVIALYNQVGGEWVPAMKVEGGNALFTGGLTVGGFIRIGSANLALAIQSFRRSIADGTVVAFGTDLGAVPDLEFSTAGLAPLAAGETYNLYADALTATGFTARLKINTPGTPSSYNLTVDTTPGTGPTRQIDKGANPDATGNNYNVTATASATFRFRDQAFGAFIDYGGTVVIGVWAKVGGVWSEIGTITFYLNGSASGEGTPDWRFAGITDTITDTFTAAAGVQAFGLSLKSHSGTYARSLDDFNSLSWTAPGSASGTRSATPAGQQGTVTVRPKN